LNTSHSHIRKLSLLAFEKAVYESKHICVMRCNVDDSPIATHIVCDDTEPSDCA